MNQFKPINFNTDEISSRIEILKYFYFGLSNSMHWKSTRFYVCVYTAQSICSSLYTHMKDKAFIKVLSYIQTV